MKLIPIVLILFFVGCSRGSELEPDPEPSDLDTVIENIEDIYISLKAIKVMIDTEDYEHKYEIDESIQRVEDVIEKLHRYHTEQQIEKHVASVEHKIEQHMASFEHEIKEYQKVLDYWVKTYIIPSYVVDYSYFPEVLGRWQLCQNVITFFAAEPGRKSGFISINDELQLAIYFFVAEEDIIVIGYDGMIRAFEYEYNDNQLTMHALDRNYLVGSHDDDTLRGMFSGTYTRLDE